MARFTTELHYINIMATCDPFLMKKLQKVIP